MCINLRLNLCLLPMFNAAHNDVHSEVSSLVVHVTRQCVNARFESVVRIFVPATLQSRAQYFLWCVLWCVDEIVLLELLVREIVPTNPNLLSGADSSGCPIR